MKQKILCTLRKKIMDDYENHWIEYIDDGDTTEFSTT